MQITQAVWRGSICRWVLLGSTSLTLSTLHAAACYLDFGRAAFPAKVYPRVGQCAGLRARYVRLLCLVRVLEIDKPSKTFFIKLEGDVRRSGAETRFRIFDADEKGRVLVRSGLCCSCDCFSRSGACALVTENRFATDGWNLVWCLLASRLAFCWKTLSKSSPGL